MFGKFVIVGVVVVLGLVIWNQATRKDTTEDYAFLCGMLFEDIPTNDVPTIKPSDAEVEVAMQKLKDEIDRLSRHCRRLAPIAKDYSLIINHAQELVRNTPQGSKIIFGLAEAVLGGYTARRELVAAGGEKVLQETEHGWNFFQEMKNLFNQKHVLAVELADLVPQFSGPATNASFVAGSFAEHKPGFLEIRTTESLSLVNSSGRDIHNCVMVVRLSNAAGNSYVNFYFVPDWLKNERRVAQYSDAGFPKITVNNIARVDVSLWAAEFSIQSIVLKMPSTGWPKPE